MNEKCTSCSIGEHFLKPHKSAVRVNGLDGSDYANYPVKKLSTFSKYCFSIMILL
jgi:hypothetical protein